MVRTLRCWWYRLLLAPWLTRIYDSFDRTSSLGKRGEREAERFYLRHGLIVVDRGYTDRVGEIDLILVDGRTVVFAEVKTRARGDLGLPEEAVDDRKQRKITKTAIGYLKSHRLNEVSVRFDVVSVIWPDPSKPPQIKHIPHAFEAAGDDSLF